MTAKILLILYNKKLGKIERMYALKNDTFVTIYGIDHIFKDRIYNEMNNLMRTAQDNCTFYDNLLMISSGAFVVSSALSLYILS